MLVENNRLNIFIYSIKQDEVTLIEVEIANLKLLTQYEKKIKNLKFIILKNLFYV